MASGAAIVPAPALAQAQGKEEVEPAGPIIPDDQFEAQLPALDPALGEPLEPIEPFEGPPAADGDPAEPVPEASIPDPALTAPLPPLPPPAVRTPPATADTATTP